MVQNLFKITALIGINLNLRKLQKINTKECLREASAGSDMEHLNLHWPQPMMNEATVFTYRTK